MTRRIAVRGIFIKDGQLLCAKLKDHKTGQPLDFWCTIGGGLDDNEALIPGLEREIMEETGIKPVVGNLLFIQQFAQGDNEHLEFFFNILNPDDYAQVDLTKSSHGTAEIARLEYIDPAAENVLPKFLTEQDYSVITPDSSTTVFSYL
ncbi:NUDIX domain-containing protein [Candidatus Saccharibacteria bacterium]|nr:NUDIX domain-containing protein [Candidatus Saccharibacteria bacterium]